MEELVDELVQLSIRHGILTPYTSFLADESVQLTESEKNTARTRESLELGLQQSEGRDAFMQRKSKNQFKDSKNLPAAESAQFGSGGGGFGGGGGFSGRAKDLRPGEQPASRGENRGRANLFSKGQRESSRPAPTASDKEGDESSPQQTVRNIGQKSFFHKNKQWRDSTVTEEQEKKAVRIKQFSKEYFDLAAKHGGELAKYLAFNEPVLLNLGDKTYQIDPPDDAVDLGSN